jgi:phosphoribosylamine-glycine ligase
VDTLKSMKRKSDFWTRKITDSIVFMQVRLQNRTVVSNGGRVLAITSLVMTFKRLKNLIKYRQATF